MSGDSDPLEVETGTLKEAAKAVQETGKAVQETGKAIQQGLEILAGAGRYTAGVAGDLPHDLVGLLGADWLNEVRKRNRARISDRTEEILRERGVPKDDRAEPNPQHLIRFLAAAADQSDETMQEWWARLLANALDPTRDAALDNYFVETLVKLTPVDALLLKELVDLVGYDKEFSEKSFVTTNFPDERLSRMMLAVDRLQELQLVRYMKPNWALTALAAELVRACELDEPDPD